MNEQVEALLRTLPRKIKIGAYDWRIKLEDGPPEETDVCGQAMFETLTIRLYPELFTGPDHAVGIVLHEINHVIFDNFDLSDEIGNNDKDEAEETIVIGFEHGTVSLYRDNPKLLTWIKRGLKNG